MDIPAALVADLATLTEALGSGDVDLTARLNAVNASISLAVASWVGTAVSTTVGGQTVTFSMIKGVDGVRASLLIPLGRHVADSPGSWIAFYASTPGAFVDLAADFAYALRADLSDLVLDADLAPQREHSEHTLTNFSLINRAIGILVEDGHTVTGARAELTRRASLAGGGLLGAAQSLVRTIDPEP